MIQCKQSLIIHQLEKINYLLMWDEVKEAADIIANIWLFKLSL